MRPLLLIPAAGILAALASCSSFEKLNRPLGSGNDGFNPLYAPGSRQAKPNEPASMRMGEAIYEPGAFVEAMIPNTTFYANMPKGVVDADRVLAQGAPLKVIKMEKSYIRVLDIQTGQEGYVPRDMVSDQPAIPDIIPVGLDDPMLVGDPGGVPLSVSDLTPDPAPPVGVVEPTVPNTTPIEPRQPVPPTDPANKVDPEAPGVPIEAKKTKKKQSAPGRPS